MKGNLRNGSEDNKKGEMSDVFEYFGVYFSDCRYISRYRPNDHNSHINGIRVPTAATTAAIRPAT